MKVKKIIKFASQSIYEFINKISKQKSSSKVVVEDAKSNFPDEQIQIHEWRLCGIGSHWVNTHDMHISPSSMHPEGFTTIRRGHCARNPSGHNDQLHPHEIVEISKKYFVTATPKPCSLKLEYGDNGNRYDDLIAGWTKYWNDVLKPLEHLNPNIIKALIATESSFDPDILANQKNPKSARGLMQITDLTRKILGNEKGELKNHFIIASREDLNDPSVNICSGIRWLFHKKKLLSSRFKRDATWNEAVFEYKGGRTVTDKASTKMMKIFFEKLEILNKCEKS